MNFLAHVYLSGNDDDIKLGNFIADSVKGNQYKFFSEAIRFGIIMHRRIDEFTDKNLYVQKSIRLLKPVYERYSGVAVDILMDHFLASQWKKYSDTDLFIYEAGFYKVIQKNYSILPERLKRFSYFLIKRKRLSGYASITEIFDVLEKMGIHTSLPSMNGEIKEVILKNYKELNNYFEQFFPQIITFSDNFLKYRNNVSADLLKINLD